MLPSLKKEEIAQLPYRKFDSTLEKIRAHYINEDVKLTDKEQRIFDRYRELFHLLCEFNSNEEAIKIHSKNNDISPMQAYRDLKAATDLFGDVLQTSKEAKKYVVEQYAMEVLKMAKNSKNPDLKEMNAAIKNLIEINGFKRDDSDLPDVSKIQPPVQILQISIDFLTSSFSNVIDDKAKDKINKLLGQITKIIDDSKINDYLDKTIDVPYIEQK